MVAAVERADLHILVLVVAAAPDEVDSHLTRQDLVGRVVRAGQGLANLMRQ